MALPGAAEVRERTVPMHYEVEETPTGPVGVVRLVLPEKVARGLVAEELPEFDRPVRFSVTRGARGTVKAASLDDLADALDRPYTDDELRREPEKPRGGRRGGGPGGPPSGPRGGDGRPPQGKFRGSHRDTPRPGSPAGRGKRRGKKGGSHPGPPESVWGRRRRCTAGAAPSVPRPMADRTSDRSARFTADHG